MQHNPTPGLVIKDRYKLIQNIGQGSFGEVWLADDLIEKKYVALKIYQWLDRDGMNTFSKEMETTKDLTHHNLLIPSEFDEWNQRPFLVMEYCGKGSVSRLAGTLDEEMAWRFIRDVASGLAYLHSFYEPIVHQDVKPYNIVISDDNTYKITDFGISTKVRDHLARHSGHRNPNAGALAYMAPERFTPDSSPLTASDIWAFGVTIFELLSGRLPFNGMGGGMLRGGAEIPNIPPQYSQRLDNLVTACLQKETWDRPTARDIENYASAVLRGESPSEPWVKAAAVPEPTPMANEIKSDLLTMGENPVTGDSGPRWKAMAAAVAGILVVGALLFYGVEHLKPDTDPEPISDTEATVTTDDGQETEQEITILTDNNINVNDNFDDQGNTSAVTGEDAAVSSPANIAATEPRGNGQQPKAQTADTPRRQPEVTTPPSSTAGSGYAVIPGEGYTDPANTGRAQNKVDPKYFQGQDPNGYNSRAASANQTNSRYQNDVRVKNKKEADALLEKAKEEAARKAAKTAAGEAKPQPPMDKNLAEAVNKGDYATVKKYADQGNTGAYLPMADYCMRKGEYANAKMYANKAIAAGNASAKRVIYLLQKMDYED